MKVFYYNGLFYVDYIIHPGWGAITSDAGVQGLPFGGVCKQGKPCTPGVISSIDYFVCITFNRTSPAETFQN